MPLINHGDRRNGSAVRNIAFSENQDLVPGTRMVTQASAGPAPGCPWPHLASRRQTCSSDAHTQRGQTLRHIKEGSIHLLKVIVLSQIPFLQSFLY